MKNNLENSIKQSLENYELEYNSSAWDAMSNKLDASAPSDGGADSSVDSAIKSSLENHAYPYNPAAWTAVESALNIGAGAAVGAGVESAMKSSLGNHEMPYNPEAWNALESKLGKSSTGGTTKWYVAASVLITAVAVSYFVLSDSSSNNETTKTSNTIAQTSNTESKNSNSTQSSNNSSNVSNTVTSNSQSSDNSNTAAGNSVVDQGNGGNGNQAITAPSGNEGNGGGTAITGGSSGVDVPSGGPTVTPTPAPAPTTPVADEFVMPAISSICEWSTVQIENENAFNLMITFPNGSMWTGKANSTTKLVASIPGTYTVGHLHTGSFVEKGSFMVHDAPTAEFDFVDLDEKYLNGLPTTEVRSSSPGTEYQWRYGTTSSHGVEATPHFFTKGNHDIVLTVTGNNGCESSVTKTVTINENYNLLAMNAFDPRSLDSRNNTYMPRALVERENVKFTMIIVSPEDGHIMYETSDASQGWDGVDRTTGEALPYQKTFIWKVTIENPEAGERPVYGGSSVIIPRQN